MSSKQSDQSGRRRVDGNVSMTSFAHRKGGHDRAIRQFRKRKELKIKEKAKQLRQYRKVMKQEGLEAAKGASRKRSLLDKEEEKASSDDKHVDQHQIQQPPPKKKRQKANPFQKSLEKAEIKKVEQEKLLKEKKEQEKQKQRKLRERRNMTKKLQQRSKKGQPIIKNMVNNLLKKLEKQAA
jgi:hypothetical protein